MKISIIIPSLGNKDYLTRLFLSLQIQNTTLTVEVLICLTGANLHLKESLPTLPGNFSVVWIPSPVRGISQARNLGLQQATGEIFFFMDEDCSLESASDLENLSRLCQENPQVVFSGRYLNSSSTSQASRFYNYMCNMWLYRHLHRITLGGCLFYYAPTFSTVALRFPEDLPVSGEEYFFSASVLRQGKNIRHIDWGVVHDPHYGWWDILKKAWSQGQTLSASPAGTPPQIFWKQIFGNARFLAPLAVYYAITRLSFLWVSVESSVEVLKLKASSWMATNRSR